MNDNLRETLTKLDALPKTARMPALFIGHGSPLNAINDSEFARTWRTLGTHLPTPQAIVCMSAHWLTDGTYITTHTEPPLIYDFYGFPDELYRVHYEARGSEQTPNDVLAHEPAVELDATRGLDHGVWTVLMHLFPTPHTIPIHALSIDYDNPRPYQFALMERLRPLRDKGVLFIGSGNIVHNLSTMQHGAPHEWALEFDALAQKLIEVHDSHALLRGEALSAAARLSLPTDDHYRPMLNTLALMHPNETPLFFNEAIDLGSVGMRSFILTT